MLVSLKGNLKKFISVFFALIIVVAFQFSVADGSFNAKALDELTTYKFSEVSDKIKIISRAAKTADGFEADAAGGGIAFNLNGSGSVTANVDFSGQVGMLGVIKNNDIDNMTTIKISQTGVQNVVIAQNLPQGSYYFEFVKLNAQYINTVVFNSITFAGTLGDKPEQKKLKLEFYGDSISCGVGSLCPSTTSLTPTGYYDHAYRSYNAYCAKYLNAEISTCAMPGYGYYFGFSYGKEQTLYPYMDRALFNKNIEFDHSSYIADVVIFELGTNDTNYAKNHTSMVSDTEIDETVQKYVDKVRSYNKECYIVLMGTTGSGTFNLKDRLNGPYMKLDNAMIRAAAVNEKVLFLQHLGMSGSGGGWHPKDTEADAGGKLLANYITENILNAKEPPTTVSNDDFYLNFDINGDDAFSVNDILVVRKYLANISSLRVDLIKADANKDSVIDLKDILLLRRKIVE